ELAQARGDVGVVGREARARVDHEQHEVAALHRVLDLALDVGPEVVAVDHADAARVAELDRAVALRARDPRRGADAVARDAGGRLDDRDAAARQAVEERGLAHVGAAHDGDARQGGGRHHGIPSWRWTWGTTRTESARSRASSTSAASSARVGAATPFIGVTGCTKSGS